jgi:hypothetical protein
MAIGKTSQVYKEVAENLKGLTEGVVISIDPSIGSSSSMPGWAIFVAGSLTPIASGVIDLPRLESIPVRLRTLNRALVKLYAKYLPDVLVYEEIPAQRHGFGNANAHASLLKSLGVILSIPGPEGYVGIMPVSWKALVSDQYEKGDEADAREIGRIVIQHAWEQVEELKQEPKLKKGKKR